LSLSGASKRAEPKGPMTPSATPAASSAGSVRCTRKGCAAAPSDQTSFSPMRADLQVAYDLAGGVSGSALWPYTIRKADQVGGEIRISQPGILVEPWNPIAGSNWIYDSMPQRATTDYGVVADPYTGLFLPNRIEKADITVKEGLPVAKTLDWLTLNFAPSIEVPGDTWVDWDAKAQKWITAAEKYTQTQTANSKVVVTYPSSLSERESDSVPVG
jgi:peptide/nickel transport system substrate-binding protein